LRRQTNDLFGVSFTHLIGNSTNLLIWDLFALSVNSKLPGCGNAGIDCFNWNFCFKAKGIEGNSGEEFEK